MKTLTALLFIAAIALTVQLYRQSSIIKDQGKRLNELQTQVAAKPKTASIEYQAKCSDQARKAFKDIGFKPKDLAGYENHFNATLNKCFIFVQNTDTTYSPTIWTHKSLFDAYEGKTYGEYSWHTVKDKKYWEVPPFMCKVILPSGADQTCKSDDEFEDLIKIYMQNP